MSGDTSKDIMTAGQLRLAREALRMSADDLAKIAGVSSVVIRRAEALAGPVRMMRANAETLRRALEALGVEFLEVRGKDGVLWNEPEPGPLGVDSRVRQRRRKSESIQAQPAEAVVTPKPRAKVRSGKP